MRVPIANQGRPLEHRVAVGTEKLRVPDALGPEGTRVNAISAGAIKTLAASGISDFRKLLDHTARFSPLRRNVDIHEVGNSAAFLCSDLASGITGEVLYVDAGYHLTGIPAG